MPYCSRLQQADCNKMYVHQKSRHISHKQRIWSLVSLLKDIKNIIKAGAYKLFLLPPGLSVATLLGRAKALGMAAASILELHLPGSLP